MQYDDIMQHINSLLDGIPQEQLDDIFISLHMPHEPQKFAEGGLVGPNPFTSQKGGIFGQMDLIHPSNHQQAPLDIPLNQNNMLAKHRAGTGLGQLYRTR